jgi:hypothetical protein
MGSNSSKQRFSGRSFLLAWLCAFAIAFQCIVVQGHFHPAAGPAVVQTAAAVAPAGETVEPARKGGAPVKSDPSTCFICQQAALAGSAILPETAAPVLLTTQIGVETAVQDERLVVVRASHIWRSRAPPLSA